MIHNDSFHRSIITSEAQSFSQSFMYKIPRIFSRRHSLPVSLSKSPLTPYSYCLKRHPFAPSVMDSDSDSVNSEVDLDDEYKNWESSIPFMYDSLIRHSLNFPSMTVEWLPYRTQSSDRRYTFQKVIIGTHAANGASDYLTIAEVKVPIWDESGVGGKVRDFLL